MTELGCSGPDCAFTSSLTKSHLLHHIRQKIPTRINHSQISLLPSRADFVDPVLKSAFAAQIKAARPILFMPNAVTEKSDYCDGIMKHRIYLFGVLPCGSKTCVILDNIDVYVDVMVPSGQSSAEYDNTLRAQLFGKNIAFTKLVNINRFKLHGFQKNKRPYKRVFFNNLGERKAFITHIKSVNEELLKFGREKLETASDDLGADAYYFPKLARELQFATADWNRIEKYEVLDAAKTTTNCAYVFRVDVNDFRKLTKDRRKEYTQSGHALCKVIDRDPTSIVMWDIETHRTIQNGQVPTPADHDYTIFMICSVYFHQYTDESMLEVCVVDHHADARPGIGLIIECGNEMNVLTAHMEVLGRMSPDIMGAFNGGNFDWPLYREKLKRANLLVRLKSKLSSLHLTTRGKYIDTTENVYKWNFKTENVKIDAETTHAMACVANFPGLLDTDVMPVFLKLYPRAEVRRSASLNFFLAKNGLDSKEDMPYKRMFKIYERAGRLAGVKSCHCATNGECPTCCELIKELDYKPIPGSDSEYSTELKSDMTSCCYCSRRIQSAKDMADVGYYCIIDCVRPQQLYVKRTIIADKRELSTMSYVSLYDAFYRADGMKVRNLIGAYCHKREIAFSNARSEKAPSDKDHYPGAWVIPPNRGLHSDNRMIIDTLLPDGSRFTREVQCRPITGLDFASLYPSLMMAYNLSTDMIVYTREEAAALEAEGYTLRHIEPFKFERGVKKGNIGNQQLTREGWTVRHNGIFNPRKDKRIIIGYIKYIKYEYKDETESPVPKFIKYPAEAGPSAEQQEQLNLLASAGTPTVRRISYEPIYGRDPLPGERMGIFAFIVKKLFDKRVPIKAEFVRLSKLKEIMDQRNVRTITTVVNGAEVTLDYKADVVFNLNKIDSKQKALKVLANTFYGESGNFRSSIYELLVAAGVTTAGQENIKKVDAFISGESFITHYGDSVTGDTPILCKNLNETAKYLRADQLGTNWAQYGDKEAADCDLYAWSESGWTKIIRVVRHYTNKNIYRVITPRGSVDVTSDHSLLDVNAEIIRPIDVKVGTRLLHSRLPQCELAYPVNFTDTKMARAVEYYMCTDCNDTLELPCEVISVTNLGATPQYVYDLETANNHFAAGIGELIVHNTDSLYSSCPDKIYADCDKIYFDGMKLLADKYIGVARVPTPVTAAEIAYKRERVALRIQWWEAQVSITMREMSMLKERVADFLLKDNGTCFLKMEYEEVGFPTVFCGKKKYFLTPHIERINFYPKEFFIKGIDIVKQGCARISKQLGDEFIREALSPDNERELIEIAEDKVRKFYETKLDPALFAQSAKYRPNKQNPPVLGFVKRMVEMQKRYADQPMLVALYEPPEAGDKFEYVIVKKDLRYSLQGCKIDINKGDQMEYVRVYKASQETSNPMELDLNYYMQNQTAGIFARFIAGYPQFQPPMANWDPTDKEQYKAVDKHSIKAAYKYICNICDTVTGYDKNAMLQRGRDYRVIYKRADAALRRDITTRYGGSGFVIHGLNVHAEDEDSRAQSTRLINQIKVMAFDMANNAVGKEYLALNVARGDQGISLFRLKRLYNGEKDPVIGRARVRACNARESVIVERLYQVIGKAAQIIHRYERGMINLIDDMRKIKFENEITLSDADLNSLNELSAEDQAAIKIVYDLMIELMAVYKVRASVLSIITEINVAVANRVNAPIEPAFNARILAHSEAALAEPIADYEWN